MAYGEHSAWECVFRHRVFQQFHSGSELGSHLRVCCLELHRIGGTSIPSPMRAAPGTLTGIRPPMGVWPKIARAAAFCATSALTENAYPRFGLGKILDHVWAAEARHDRGRLRRQHAVHRRRLFLRQGHASFAVGHANEKRQNHGIVRP